MRLKETQIHELGQMFEEGLNRLQKVDKREKVRLRRRIRDELFSLLGWELASPTGILKRFEDRMPDLFRALPYGFKDELLDFLVNLMSIDRGSARGKSEVELIRDRKKASKPSD